MIQTIAQDGTRTDLGMHYTSVPNIMKVLQPLLLDDLHESYIKAKDSVGKLNALLARLSNIRIFDPACGCGNFLIIAYKALRELEMRILSRIAVLSPNNPLRLTGISLHNFFGVDISDFACETAKLSLWIAEYQMNAAFKELFGTARPPLPLGKIATIHRGNSVQMDWFRICPSDNDAETYICGNPPYQGSVGQHAEQKADITSIFASFLKIYKDVDYVSCWFVKLSDYIEVTANTAGAFVATNSICQGEQIAFLWPHIFSKSICISFAHTSFRWSNSASNNAGVTCIIVGLRKTTSQLKHLYTDSYHVACSNINAYLVPSSSNLIINKSPVPLNTLPPIVLGSKPSDGGNLILSPAEKTDLLSKYPEAAPLIRRFYGSKELLYNLERYALWITDKHLSLAQGIPPIARRISNVAEVRKMGGSQAREVAQIPYRFARTSYRSFDALILPEVSSERRRYLQIGLIGASDIASNLLWVIYSPPAYLVALLSSRLHRIWAQTVGGKLEERLRYSGSLVYNTFPVPSLSDDQKRVLGEYTRLIITARAKYPGKAMAWLYNPETMPTSLFAAHQENDAYLEESVYGRAFKDDTHRLEHLFSMYAAMRAREHTPILVAATSKLRNATK